MIQHFKNVSLTCSKSIWHSRVSQLKGQCLLLKWIEGLVEYFFVFIIRSYQLLLSPYMGGQCRFYPSCSHYALRSIQLHGLKGIFLAGRRLLKCHPFSGQFGYDPVPRPQNEE